MVWLPLILLALLMNAFLIWTGIRALLRSIRNFQEVVLGCENTMSRYGKAVDDKLEELMAFSQEISNKLSDLEKIEDHLSPRRPGFRDVD